MPKEPSKKAACQLIIDAAEQHGQDSEPDHEVGDLQDALRACFKEMTHAQAVRVYESQKENIVRELLS
jgi:hypothetical protein